MVHFFFQLQETFLLGIGALLFFGAGCMIITSFDNVPESLVDNAIILGLLAIFTGFIFVIDICCLRQRTYADKVDRQEKEYGMKKNGNKFGNKETVLKKKSELKTVKTEEIEKPQEKVMSELRSSIKKNKKENTEDRSTFRVENEKVQTKENTQYGRKYLKNRGFIQTNSKRRQSSDEPNNGYDYDVQSIKNYEDKASVVYTDSNDSSDTDSESDLRYNKKSRGSQTSRKHFVKDKSTFERIAKDAETLTDSSIPLKSSLINTDIQSQKISTTDPHKSDSPTSEESYKLQHAASSSYLISSGKKFQPVMTSTRVERLTQNAQTLNREPESIPSSPQDPGYVLHTASKWPNTKPLGPQPYQKWEVDSKRLKSVQSVV